ncbi:MAG: response regulator transcription factor [Clostridia bacterium]|nr:response regulator transcription factor [Clostridia bacterium]
MPRSILVVDDEPSMVKGLQYNLQQLEGYDIDVAYDGEEAMEKFDPAKHDLVLLDLMLPKRDGMEVCQLLRAQSDVPIIMLTAKGDDMDKIMGLEIGADDYLTKPFNMLELKARIKSLLRRTAAMKAAITAQVVRIQDLKISLANRTVEIDGREVDLTAKEFDLLNLFISNRGQVFPRDVLLGKIWKHQGDARTVDVHIRRLREKIERNPAKPEYILTKWGVGYYFADI